MADEIIEELWRIKDGIAEDCGHDLDALVAHLRGLERAAGRRIAHPKSEKKTVEPIAAPEIPGSRR